MRYERQMRRAGKSTRVRRKFLPTLATGLALVLALLIMRLS